MVYQLVKRYNSISELDGPTMGREEFAARVLEKTNLFALRGLKKGDRAVILHGNSIEFFTDLLGLWNLGCSAIPLNAETPEFELRKIATHSRARAVIFDGISPFSLEQAFSIVISTREKVSSATESWYEPRPFDEALILYTSGTTGEPKGIVHTFLGLANKWRALGVEIPARQVRKTLCVLPTFFGHGLICNSLFPIFHGAQLFIGPAFDERIVMSLGEVLDRHEISFMSSVPTLWRMVLGLDLSPTERGRLLRIHCASEPLTNELWAEVARWSSCPSVFNVYGTTETAGWISGGRLAESSGHIGFGWGCRFAVAGENGELLGPYEHGHILARSDSLMAGYLDNEKATAEVLRDGWYVTGDIGYITHTGSLHWTGREKNYINKGGMKIYAEEIESHVMSHPGVKEGCAFLIEGGVGGESLGLAIVRGEGHSLEDIKRWFQITASSAKWPARWFDLEALPRGGNKKIMRHEVIRICERSGC